MNELLLGDPRELLYHAPAESVQTVVTSPPYWGLRDYGVEGQIGLEPVMDCLGWATGERCGECFICHMVDVFRAVRHVLKKDGTCWVNMGDGYAGSRSGPEGDKSTLQGSRRNQNEAKVAKAAHRMVASRRRDDEPIPRSDVRIPGLKPKDMMTQPWRLGLALQADGWWLRQDIIWRKPNPMPETVHDRCTKSHEYLLLLSKSKRYYYDANAIKEQASDGTRPRRAAQKMPAGWDTGPGAHDGLTGRYPKPNGVGWGYAGGDEAKPRTQGRKFDPGSGNKNNADYDDAMSVMPESRNKRSVWDIPTEAFPGAHFATFPRALVRPCLLAASRPGDVVLDPFMGSGTTAAVAIELGRQWLGCELNPAYRDIALKRIAGAHPGLAL